MELLATVHWVNHHGGANGEAAAATLEAATARVRVWNPRKQRVFKPEHIRAAWQQLREAGWLTPDSDCAPDSATVSTTPNAPSQCVATK